MNSVYSVTNMRKAIQLIIDKFEEDEAFHLINIDDIVNKYEEFQEVLPQVLPFYAVKCNNNIMILKVLVALGCGFDCATKNEIQTMLSLGVSPDKIVYSHPIKQESHLQYAASVNVDMMAVDCISELHKIKKIYPTAKLVLRISYDDESCNHKFGDKFGCDPDNEAFELLCVAKSLKLNVIGVSFHVGSGCNNCNAYRHAIEMAQKVFALGKTIGFNMVLLDIGGGFPGANQIDFHKIGRVVNDAIQTYFPCENVQIIAEPGRYFVESAVTIACRIVSMKNRNEKISYYLNDGRCGSFSFLNFAYEPFELKILKDLVDPEMHPSTIYGPTCWGEDIVDKSIYLPQLQINDWLYLEKFGAYKQVVFTTFNGFSMPKMYAICSTAKWNLFKTDFPNSVNKIHEHGGTCMIINNN
ncbi:ornithine decarboxylase 1-like [Chrysoperla carnea]|uniref:ornithine decarboxylase 1-like n=1 Tax=Chrysoperla carnea TaxID=189513 RepID=UPI001D079BDA|nr:ornithine decarboxylase 1-like [Chrysoperla carnea]